MTFMIHSERIFGFSLYNSDARTIARSLSTHRRTQRDGVGLIVTPNLDHVITLRRNVQFAQAYRRASIVVCDGFPVHYYAALCGIKVQRATGCDIVSHLMATPSRDERFFFVVDSETTALAVQRWADSKAVQAMTAVPPHRFERDEDYNERLIEQINDHQTTMLIMGVGAPKSEIWVDSHRESLPSCWALCAGQSVRVYLGITRRAPLWMRKINLEWLWRISQEPRRLAVRYLRGLVLFPVAIVEDRMDHWLHRLAWRQTTGEEPLPVIAQRRRTHEMA